MLKNKINFLIQVSIIITLIFIVRNSSALLINVDSDNSDDIQLRFDESKRESYISSYKISDIRSFEADTNFIYNSDFKWTSFKVTSRNACYMLAQVNYDSRSNYVPMRLKKLKSLYKQSKCSEYKISGLNFFECKLNKIYSSRHITNFNLDNIDVVTASIIHSINPECFLDIQKHFKNKE